MCPTCSYISDILLLVTDLFFQPVFNFLSSKKTRQWVVEEWTLSYITKYTTLYVLLLALAWRGGGNLVWHWWSGGGVKVQGEHAGAVSEVTSWCCVPFVVLESYETHQGFLSGSPLPLIVSSLFIFQMSNRKFQLIDNLCIWKWGKRGNNCS